MLLSRHGTVVLAVLLALGGLVVWTLMGTPDPNDGATVPRQSGSGATASVAQTSAQVVEAAPASITDIFAVRTWAPPPPPPAKPMPPPPPQAPPLPFKFLGQIDDGPQGRAFMLAYGERVVVATPGTTIDERYRLDKFEGAQLHFMYLPLNVHQTLSVGNSL